MDNDHFKLACEFTIKLARIAHRNGAQSRRLEFYLLEVIKSFGYDGVFRVTPSEIVCNFFKNKEIAQITHTLYMEKIGFHLITIDRLGELVSDMRLGKVTLQEASMKLNDIEKAEPKEYGRYLTALGYALAGFGFAGFLRCSLLGLILAAFLGVLVYVMCSTDKILSRSSYGLPFVCAFTVGVIASIAQLIFSGIDVYLISLSALIYLIPGFTITCGIIEISYKYVLSGIINLVNGLVYLMVIFFGTFSGVSLVKYFFPAPVSPASHIHEYFSWPLAIIMACGLCIIFQIPRKYFGWAMISIILVCLSILVGKMLGGVNMGNLMGSIVAIIFANVWSAKYQHPESIILIPSVVFLVSGSIGFRGFVALSSNNIATGGYDLMQMFLVAIMIALGLGIGNSIYRPKISL